MKTSTLFPIFFNCLSLLAACTIAHASGAPGQPDYVTSEACASCHQQQFDAWSGSHHSWAWREPAAANVLGDFNSAEIEHAGFTYRFVTDDDTYAIIADNADGKSTRYPVRYVVGVTPLQQYLVETEPGRLQAMDLAWDTERKRWYHLYPDQDTSAGNGMHWSGSYKNWNARCAECHATDFKKNYEPLQDRYRSTQAEIGVGCEACHGPGEAHLSWAEEPDAFDSGRWSGTDAKGLQSVYQTADAASEINVCAPCHSRREPLGADSAPPGTSFDDHYRLSLIRDGLYFPDGQIRDEVYVYGSFLQSKMYAAGVKCTNCHDAHSYRVRLDGNGLCTQCHNPSGNPAFPTLTKADYDSADHHFHPQDSESARCTSCHLPERDYMLIDGRRDHSFRVPRPDLSEKLGTPDVCTGCHKDQTTAWAMQQIDQRFASSRIGRPHFAEVFATADQGVDADSAGQLVQIATDASMPAIVRASALQRLGNASFSIETGVIQRLQSDSSPLVRAAVPRVLGSAPEKDRMAVLEALLEDPLRSVRIEAVKIALSITTSRFSAAAQQSLATAMREWQDSLRAKADFPEIQMVIGGAALTLRNLPAATSAFQTAVTMDPQLVQAWVMLARIEAVEGDRAAVRKTLETAIQANPDNAILQQALRDLVDSGDNSR